jgi:ADP-ribosylglycohydrolase
MKREYIEKIYAGWLAKIIGIRLGAPIEGWTYEKIKNVYGEIHNYPVDYKRFAADDDWNGPIFFVRALEDREGSHELRAQDVAEALLNYAPYEHGFFWWGGYGISTEHTAYLNLREGILAPRSGSIEQNGHAVAEQIGGQIFIDSWGLVNPGNTDMAAKMAETAASVTHDGNGIYGGVFIAVCISHAFEETSIRKIIEKGLSYIPENSEYTRVVRKVMDYYDNDSKKDWRGCYDYIHKNFGYDKYLGNCHIIPNSAVMILALLYGEGDFDNTLNICNMCGWDTDCNVGNIATIMGIVCGLDKIDYFKWRKPINDFLACSSVVGSLNIMDIPYGATYMVKLAYDLVDEKPPKLWHTIINDRIDSCHFEFPGSTHAIEARRIDGKSAEATLVNSTEQAATGKRSLKVHGMSFAAGERALVYKRTYLASTDFDNSRYDPSFSPLVYPGQVIRGSVYIPDYGNECSARLYVMNGETGEIIEGDSISLVKGEWQHLSFEVPFVHGGRIDEAGFAFDMHGMMNESKELICFIDDFYFEGSPNYTVDFSLIKEDFWNVFHREITQFTKLKGLSFLEDEMLHLSCSDFAEMYTGHHKWKDYFASFVIRPYTGKEHFVNIRVQGAMRSYAVGFSKDKLCLKKNENGYRILKEVDFSWEPGLDYEITVSATGNRIHVTVDKLSMMEYVDDHKPYLTGGIGISVFEGSHCGYRFIKVG